MKGIHLLSTNDLDQETIYDLIDLSKQILKSPQKFTNICEGKLLATLFFEPSTRTRLSFEAAMLRLGGKLLGFSDAGVSSTTKGETLVDTIKTVCAYVDAVVMRHPKEGSAKLAAANSNIPIINAGDGGHQHPTQTLTDLLTISQAKGRLDNLSIGLCGDLKFGRTVHSLVEAMSMFEGNTFYFISPEELKIPDYIKENPKMKNIKFAEVEKLEDAINDVDILYMTRVQKERFFNEADYIRLKDSYILTLDKLKNAKKDMAILHPLPRVNEIAPEVDSDPRAVYFEQVHYGMIVRMALIIRLLGVKC